MRSGPTASQPGIVEEGVGDDARRLPVEARIDGDDSCGRACLCVVSHWRKQGDAGELSAIAWFVSKGADVYLPLGHSPDVGLHRGAGRPAAARAGRRHRRVARRRSLGALRSRHGVETRAGAEWSSGSTESLRRASSPSWATVAVGTCRRKPSAGAVRSSSAVRSYEGFEVEPGDALPPRTRWRPRLQSAARNHWGDVRVAKGDAAVNRVALPTQVRILLPPYRPESRNRAPT